MGTAPMTASAIGFSTHNARNDVSVTHQICRLISDLLIAETRCFNQLVAGQPVLLLQRSQKRLSEMSSLFDEIRLPRGSTFNHGVEDDQELVHTGGQCHLLWLAFLTEAFIERLNHFSTHATILLKTALPLTVAATANTARFCVALSMLSHSGIKLIIEVESRSVSRPADQRSAKRPKLPLNSALP